MLQLSYCFKYACIVLLWTALAAKPGLSDASPASLYYTATYPDGGGLGRLTVDGERGALVDAKPLYVDASCDKPDKMAVLDDGDMLAFAHAGESHQLVILDLSGASQVLTAELPERPDAVVGLQAGYVVAGNKGGLWHVNAQDGQVTATWSAEEDLIPPGWKIESLNLLPDGERLLATFQKDKADGLRFGSRLILLNVPELELIYDMPLPRSRPDLHYPPKVNLKEQGPNPEEIFVDTTSNTLTVTADLYGALATADLGATLEQGRWVNFQYQSTAVDGSWGDSFPDRGLQFEYEDRPHLLVTNAGEAHGAVMMDLTSRDIVHRYETQAGLESLTYVRETQTLLAAPAGKIKTRGEREFAKRYEPLEGFYIWQLDKLDERLRPTMQFLEVDAVVRWLCPVPGSSRHVVLVGEVDDEDTFMLYDLERREVVDQREVGGTLARLIQGP